MNHFLQKLLISISLAAAVLVPQTAIAQTDSCAELRDKFKSFGSTEIGQLPEYCNVEAVYQKFINLALYAVGVVAVAMIIYGGYVYMTAASNEDQRKRGKTVLTWSIIGLVVVLAATVLVNIVVKFLVEK